MATYVFFEGFGEWTCTDLPIVESSYQSGYLMLSPMDERRYKHLGILSPHELVPCEENITGCIYQNLKRFLEEVEEKDEDFFNAKDLSYWIDYEKKHSLVVVDLKDIQTADQHPAQTSSQESEVSTMQALNTLSNLDYITKDLAILNRAAIELWGNVDPNDKTKHPDQPTVIKWLKLNKISSEASAIQGATIIRPNWAKNNGRPTKKEV